MKVMLPIREKEAGEEKIAHGFHNARYVCIYDSEKEAFEWKSAQEISANPGDFSEEIKQLGISTIISAYLPPMALRIFARNGLNVLKARGSNVKENISFFVHHQLESFTTEASRQMWGCESGCGSCNSKSCA